MEEDEDGEDGIQEFRLALEDVGVHFEEAAARIMIVCECSIRCQKRVLQGRCKD